LKLTKSREDIKRSSFKILRNGKSKEGVPDEVSCIFFTLNGSVETVAGPCPRLQEWQAKEKNCSVKEQFARNQNWLTRLGQVTTINKL
jgi:hypothetical protein